MKLQTTQLVKETFFKWYDPTIEEVYKKEIVVEGMIYIVKGLDTAGTIIKVLKK